MGTNKIAILLISMLSFLPFKILAAIQYGNIETLTISEGINNNTVYDIVRGQRGYIWFATDMGISRYDGFHFRNFPNTPNNDSAEKFPQAVHRIYPNNDGLLYLQLHDGGIACFDISKEKYLPIEFNRPIDNKKINGIYLAEKYVLYLACTEGLYTGEVKRSDSNQEESIQISLSEKPLVKGNISLLRGDDKGNLFYCLDKTAVVHYSMGTRHTYTINFESNPKAEVSTLYVKDDHLWIGRKFENIAFYDYNRKSLRTLSDSKNESLRLSDTYITDFTQKDDNTFYCSTWQGLYCIEFKDKAICDSPYSIESISQHKCANRLPVEDKMTSLLWDNVQNILWVGTFGGGAIKFNFNENVYNRITQQLGTEINDIEEDGKGYVWLATERKGVWRSTSNILTSSSSFVPWTKGVKSSESYQIYKDKNGGIWVGDENSGIVYINPFTEETQSYKLSPAGTKNFSGRICQFCLDSRGKLWIATNQGVVLFNSETNESSLIIKPEGKIKEITAIAEDKEGDIWIGTNVGVKRLETENGKYFLDGEYEEQVGIPDSPVSSIYINSSNQIFVSYTDKIIRIDGRDKEKTETLFTLNNGLSSGHILCMIDDSNGNTWVGSNSGIMTIRNDQNSFYNYLLSGYYNEVSRLRDGRLLWSDSWGLIYFDPMSVKSRKNKKQLLLSDLWVNGKAVAVGEEINGQTILHTSPDGQKSFVFDANNNHFCFYFSDMQYDMMQRKIAYRLLPDEKWELCALENGIHFSNLKSGTYTLQVKLIYPDASEGQILEVSITVKAYWWSTIWAIIGYIIVVICIFFGIYYYLLRKRKIQFIQSNSNPGSQGNIALQVQNEEKNRVRNIVATRFIAELRTPLSMIIAPLREGLQERELSKGLSTKMLIAYRNSMGMLNSCDQLLAIFSYAPKAQIELSPYSITKLTDSFVFSMSEFLRVHPIEFQYEKKIKKDLEVWVDKKALNLILQNMLANAFMHLRYSGAVALILQEAVENDIHYCIISVVDNGKANVRTVEEIGPESEDLEQIDPVEVELGYTVMEDIMKQHHGSVSLENLKGSGTKIQIKFPVDKAIFESDENVVFINPEEEEEEIILPKQGTPIKTYQSEEKLLLSEEEQLPVDTYSNISGTKKTILIVEDYKDIRLYLKTLFEKEYNILLAVNGNEGVEIAKKELPDLVISDIMMPEKDGYECCREIKEGLETCHIPVILLTAKVEDEDIIKGLEIGADDYILKPFTPKILKAKVKSLIEGRMNLKNTYTHLLVTPPEEDANNSNDDKEVEIEDPFISTVVKIVEENLQEPDFSVKKLASDLNMSQPTLYRKVKQCTDFTIIELIRGVRMKRAATLLKKKQYQVQEVAEMVGYNDIPTFRKHFIDTYGTPPSTFADSGAV